MALFATLHLAFLAVILVTLSQWTTNDSNLYSAALSFVVVVPEARVPRGVYAIGVGALGTGLAVAGLADHFLGFLSILGLVFGPLGGAYTGRYFLVTRCRFEGQPASVIPTALVAWAAGVFTAWLVTPDAPQNNLFGCGLLTLTTVPPVDGFLVSFTVAAILGRAALLWEGNRSHPGQE